jgi:hypothetical protein
MLTCGNSTDPKVCAQTVRGELDLTRWVAATLTTSLVFAIAGRGHRTVTRRMHPVVALPIHAKMIQATWRMQQSFPPPPLARPEPELQDRCKRHRLLVRDCDSEKYLIQELGALHRGLEKLAAAGSGTMLRSTKAPAAKSAPPYQGKYEAKDQPIETAP